MKTTLIISASLLLSSLAQAECGKASSSSVVATMTNTRLVETSGMDFSRKHQGIFWAHNDANNQGEIFAIGADGKTYGEVLIDGVSNKDWEDISVAACYYNPSIDCLYIGDIGNNKLTRNKLQIYVVEEPADLSTKLLQVAKTITIPSPGEYNFEAFAVNEKTFDFYLISKGSKKATVQGESVVFKFTAEDPSLKPLATYDLTKFPGVTSKKDTTVTSADIDENTQTLLLGTRGQAYEVKLDSLQGAVANISIPKLEQSEAISYYKNGIMTTSEGLNQPLVFVSCGN